ncbi:hypothetical protein OEB94_08945 [Streptomyces sp. ICN988]|uniref:hypothetical protein n=1 Tax=Streptomyces sp. ICN988 TaxID=2983765 RepID=UPI0021E50FC5|nr:hypothetical protein [Streptomyces sp. ICN988]MCV2459387.1 hypothetical protein [Streptomyces sp. ICN988]
MAGESTLAEWAGKSATVFKDEFSGVPKNLKKLEKSYGMCGDALADFWPKLEPAQALALADKALIKARVARDDLSCAQSKLSSADSWATRASKEADKSGGVVALLGLFPGRTGATQAGSEGRVVPPAPPCCLGPAGLRAGPVVPGAQAVGGSAGQ